MTFFRQRSPIYFLPKNLSINFTTSLNFEYHINITNSKALKLCGFLSVKPNCLDLLIDSERFSLR